MKNKAFIPYLSAIAIFLLLAVIFCSPTLQGKKVHMGDIAKYKGQSKELNEYKDKTGEDALWTNSMFGGMPSYLIKRPKAPWLTAQVNKILNLNNFRPVSFIFLYMLGFFIALLCFKVNPWISIVGAIAYGFSSYFFILIPAGHAAKATTLGYLPAIVGGVYLAYNGKRLLGSAIFGLFLAIQMLINHLQMTYYTFIIIGIFGIAHLVHSIEDKKLKDFLLTTAFLVLFGILAIGSNFRTLWTTYEYGKYSIRGESELTTNSENKTSGLDKDYVTQWSYGIAESFTLLIPNFMGGASQGPLPEDSETFEFLARAQGNAQARKTIKQMPTYWGDQPITNGPVYVGAIVCFLFILGLFIVDKKLKWWLLVVTLVSLILSWGRNIPNFTNFLLDTLPGYNKFRAVSSALVIAQFSMPLLAILALAEIIKGELSKKELQKALIRAFAITGGLALFFALFGKSLFNFESPIDQQYLAQGANQIVDAWQNDRAMLLRKDAFRSLLFIALAAGLLYYYIKDKLTLKYVLTGMAILILVDMWPVDKRYLNNDNFETKRENRNPYVASAADKAILQDPDPHYRVMNLSISPFQDASTSYFHKSIGGYHGAKWRRIQELYEHNMIPEYQKLGKALQSQNMDVINQAFENAPVLSMFNIKYLILDPQQRPLYNPAAAGNAWFVPKYKIVPDADAEIAALTGLDLDSLAIIDERFADEVRGKQFKSDSTASIQLDEYRPNYLKYSSSASSEQLALFSEVYYPKGWLAKIDGEPTSHFRANYMLRSMIIPAGEHTIEFSFEPQSYNLGGKVAMASSWILFLSLIGAIALSIKQGKKEQD